MEKSKNIHYLIWGVQFNHSFKMLDYWGEIADHLLYKSTYFGTKMFDNISTQYTTERILSNSKTGDSLTLTASQLVFRYIIKNSFEDEYKDFEKKVTESLIPDILVEYNLIIRRLGLVFGSILDDSDIMKFSEKYFKPEVKNITDFRFSKKETSKQALLWNGTNDYVNKIFTVGYVLEEQRGIVYDYQLYFNPVQADIRSKITLFFKEGLNNFNIDIIEVLS